MGLLAPLFLLGAFAIALPIWLHRLQTQSSERKPFSSAMLLETAQHQVHVKKKLKYLLLLALRILLLSLIALAFAKPFLPRPPNVITATDSGTRLILVDTSVSMGRAGVFSQAIAEANGAVNDAPGDALIQVLAADSVMRISTELNNDKATHRSAISSLSLSALRLDYGEVMRAIERLAASSPAPVSLHFVSDFQSSAMPARFSDLIPGSVSEFVPHVVGTGEPFNWSVEFVRETADGIDVGLNGQGDRERVGDIELVVNDVVVESRGLNQTWPQVVRFDIPEYESGENRLTIRINTDDDFLTDNIWHHVVTNDPPTVVPIISLDLDGLPATYLSAALESAGEYQVDPLIVGDFDHRVLSRYRWLAIDDIGMIDPQLEQALTEYLQGGGNILAFAGDRAASIEVLPLTGHRRLTTSIESSTDSFLSIGQVDSRHPALSLTEGWQSVSVTRSLPLETSENDQILIQLENNDPFLLERRLGPGRLLLLPTQLDSRWSDLPVRPVFVSFVIEAARYLSGINEIEKTYTTGANLPLAVTGSASGQVVDPDGNTVLSLADTTREQQIKLNKPGFYEVYTSQGETVVAANIDPRESDLRRVREDVLDRWRGATGSERNSGSVEFYRQEAETVELWHWILLILTVIVIGESILGNIQMTLRRMERA